MTVAAPASSPAIGRRPRGPALVLHQLRYEQKSYWRNPAAAFFTAAFPLMFLVIFGSLNRGATLQQYGGLAYNQYYVPAILAFGVIGACFTNLAMTLSIRRHYGQLKRKRATPLPAWALLGGLIASSVVTSALLVVLTVGAGIAFYNLSIPASAIGPIALVLVLGAACFCALGVAMQSLIPNADAAPAIVNGVLLPIVFISGTFFPIASDNLLGKIAGFFPVRHFTQALFTSANPGVTGGLKGSDLAWLGGWLVVGALVAIKRFRWEPGHR